MVDMQLLVEQATLARLVDGFGFIYVIHTNDHNPAHIHLYLSQADVAAHNTYTRLLIPKNTPNSIADIQVYSGDTELTTKQKKMVLSWFEAKYKKKPLLTNYVLAASIWEVYQDDQKDAED